MDPATITLTDLDWPGWIQIYILIGMVCRFYERVLYVKVDYAKFGKGFWSTLITSLVITFTWPFAIFYQIKTWDDI